MTIEIHAHQVLNLLKQMPMTEAALREAVSREFGTHARFHTCKLNGMDLDALLAFLQEKRKVIIEAGIWHLNEARICQH
ncbi:YecH family metal-binding protein [Vibrio fluvialis]|uniref:YecH family metal-binding protein n=1 Tax=Vibrio fluvialis TaxID=676 RepID=UPI0006E2C584|nr:YecH family metal-binding protein [Vibrio fluvialis]EKO3374642.1 YecH family protein [Vibrio fluvialis]EKO3382966.1 YecH family protein [Vibrio fluvialis]EKO3418553.1 YecH family protein [Vibrio fluvialis]EKO3514839.1 YecH family protein [Vibrio fluvialis]EKO3948844.1 YecH family protein [Vibrio fluvialis]